MKQYSFLPPLDVTSRHSRQVNECNYLNIMEIKKNPVRDYRSVERRNITMLCIPSGMQPVFCDSEAFLWNAGVTRECHSLPSDIP